MERFQAVEARLAVGVQVFLAPEHYTGSLLFMPLTLVCTLQVHVEPVSFLLFLFPFILFFFFLSGSHGLSLSTCAVIDRDMSNMMPSRSLSLRQTARERAKGCTKGEMGRERERDEGREQKRIFRHTSLFSLSLSLTHTHKHTCTHTF